MRMGYSNLHKELPRNGTWVVLGDVTVDIGTIKGLVTVGVNIDKLEERENFKLSLHDLQIIGIHPTEQANGEFAKEAFQKDAERVEQSGTLAALIIDEGPDVKKGAKLLQKANMKVKVIHDITHKLSLTLEKELTTDPKWDEFTKQLTRTRQQLQQTEFAALRPPKQRSKARFMNIALYIEWPNNILKSKREGSFKDIPEDRYEQYFGWLLQFAPYLERWGMMVGVIEMMKEITRLYGLSNESYDYLIDTFIQMPIGDAIDDFIGQASEALFEEVRKLEEGQVLPASTEALESLFGSYKYHTAEGGHGITGNILTIGTLAGPSQTTEEIIKSLEATPVSKVNTWIQEKFGNTVAKIRNRFLSFKGTKFDSQTIVTSLG
jgi:hypothetical protein